MFTLNFLVGSLLLVGVLTMLSPSIVQAQLATDNNTSTRPLGKLEDIPQQQLQDNSSVEQQNKAIVIAFTNASNDRNYTAVEQYVAEDIIEHRPGVMSGRNSTIQFLQSLAKAFPDFHTNIDQILAEGDKVVVFTTTNGTQQGEFIFAPGIPPTGKQVSFKTADMYRISNGQIAEHWDVIEILDLMTQIGALTFSQPIPLPIGNTTSGNDQANITAQ
jgi:steroid delta-isomerase-like uncharacterized protein